MSIHPSIHSSIHPFIQIIFSGFIQFLVMNGDRSLFPGRTLLGTQSLSGATCLSPPHSVSWLIRRGWAWPPEALTPTAGVSLDLLVSANSPHLLLPDPSFLWPQGDFQKT